MKVDKVRKQIDSIDEKILQLLNDRAEASKKIGRIKLREGQGRLRGVFQIFGLLLRRWYRW